MVCYLASPGEKLVIHNKAVVDYGAIQPRRVCSDSALRKVIEMHQSKKQLLWRWIPTHRNIKHYHHYHYAEEKKEI